MPTRRIPHWVSRIAGSTKHERTEIKVRRAQLVGVVELHRHVERLRVEVGRRLRVGEGGLLRRVVKAEVAVGVEASLVVT